MSHFLLSDPNGNITLHDRSERDRWIKSMDDGHEDEAIRKGNEYAKGLHDALDLKIGTLNTRAATIETNLNSCLNNRGDKTKAVCINDTCINESQLKKLIGLVDGSQHFELATYYANGTSLQCAFGLLDGSGDVRVGDENRGCQGDKPSQSHHRWHLRLL